MSIGDQVNINDNTSSPTKIAGTAIGIGLILVVVSLVIYTSPIAAGVAGGIGGLLTLGGGVTLIYQVCKKKETVPSSESNTERYITEEDLVEPQSAKREQDTNTVSADWKKDTKPSSIIQSATTFTQARPTTADASYNQYQNQNKAKF